MRPRREPLGLRRPSIVKILGNASCLPTRCRRSRRPRHCAPRQRRQPAGAEVSGARRARGLPQRARAPRRRIELSSPNMQTRRRAAALRPNASALRLERGASRSGAFWPAALPCTGEPAGAGPSRPMSYKLERAARHRPGSRIAAAGAAPRRAAAHTRMSRLFRGEAGRARGSTFTRARRNALRRECGRRVRRRSIASRCGAAERARSDPSPRPASAARPRGGRHAGCRRAKNHRCARRRSEVSLETFLEIQQ